MRPLEEELGNIVLVAKIGIYLLEAEDPTCFLGRVVKTQSLEEEVRI